MGEPTTPALPERCIPAQHATSAEKSARPRCSDAAFMTLSNWALVIGFVTAGWLAYDSGAFFTVVCVLSNAASAVNRTDSSDTADTASAPLAGAATRSPPVRRPPGRLTTGADRPCSTDKASSVFPAPDRRSRPLGAGRTSPDAIDRNRSDARASRANASPRSDISSRSSRSDAGCGERDAADASTPPFEPAAVISSNASSARGSPRAAM